MIPWLVFLFSFSFSAFAKGSFSSGQRFYVGTSIAKPRYYNERIQSYGTRGTGHAYSFHGGFKNSGMALEGFVHVLNTRTEPMQYRGDQRYYLRAKSFSYGALTKLYMRSFNFRFGYAFHHFDLQLKPDTAGPEIEDPLLSSEFGETEKNRLRGPLFGVGMDLPIGFITPYFAATAYQISKSKTNFIEFAFGLNFSI